MISTSLTYRNTASLAALPDSYFEPTAEELKSAYSSQSRLVDKLSNAPLKTEAIRQRETKEKLARWPEVRRSLNVDPNRLINLNPDPYPHQIPEPTPAREDLPVKRHDQIHLRVRTELSYR